MSAAPDLRLARPTLLAGVAFAIAVFVAAWTSKLFLLPAPNPVLLWHGAGIALGGLLVLGRRHWPSIAVGSFAYSVLALDLASPAPFDARTLATAAGCTLGEVVAALAASALLTRHLGVGRRLDSRRTVLAFVLLSGPVSGLIGATIAVGSAMLGGFVPLDQAFRWLWPLALARTFGVLIVLPLAWAWCGGGREGQFSRALRVALPVVFVALAALGASRFVLRLDRERMQRELTAVAAEVNAALEQQRGDASGLSFAIDRLDGQQADQLRITRFGESAQYLTTHRSLGAWLVLVIGLALAWMLGIFQLLVAGRASAVEELVRARTADLARANRMLEQRTREAQSAVQARSDFLAHMSHEIRTPMTVILGYTQFLADPALSDDERRAHVEVVRRNGRHLLRVIDDVLDMSRIEAGQVRVERVRCSPAAILQDVVGALRPQCVDKGLILEARVVGSVPETIESDPTRIHQVLVNLVGNAIKFTESGGVVAELVQPSKDVLAFRVVDTGPGLTPAEQTRIFDAFTQGDSSTHRRHNGAGLGLTISRRLARLLGGAITVESRPGSGAVFTFTLSALVVQSSAQHDTIPARPPAQVEIPKLAARFLVAEDKRDSQALLAAILRRAGAEFTIVGDGAAALSIALAAEREGRPFDVVLMDLQMPELDGYEATRALREAGCSRPIIALTAHALPEDRQRALDAGCDAYVTKPIDPNLLIEVSRTLLLESPAQFVVKTIVAAAPPASGSINTPSGSRSRSSALPRN